jgi:hypothetical protein
MDRTKRRTLVIAVLAALVAVNVLVVVLHRSAPEGSRGGTGGSALVKDSGNGPTIDGSGDEPDIFEDYEDLTPDNGTKG